MIVQDVWCSSIATSHNRLALALIHDYVLMVEDRDFSLISPPNPRSISASLSMAFQGNPGAPLPPVAVPTEDAVQVLVNHLVSPLLPLLPIAAKIIDPQQVIVAKQMHAVVLLYNYYHRKQFPQLEFLGFESFCKLAVITKPSLLMYMKFMRVSKEDYGDLDNQLSVTEKMVMDACKICKSLDASINSPNTENWPISKVAVLLVDPAKEKCLLQFSRHTQGVWSLVEKDLDMPFGNLVRGEQNKKHKSENEITASGSTGNKSNEMDDLLEKIALSAVRDNTGIDQSNLGVLEHHIAYSLSSEKATTRLYIMMYRTGSEELTEIPLKDVLRCLKDPLFKRSPSVEVAPAVEYYHLLPYTDILTDYLSREAPYTGSLHVRPRAIRKESCVLESMVEGVDIHNKCDQIDLSPNSRFNKIRKTEHANISKIRSDPTSAEAVHKPSTVTGKLAMEIDGLPVTVDPGTTDKSLCKPPRITAKLAMELDELPVMGDQRTPDKALCRPPRTTVCSSKGILSKGKIILPKSIVNIKAGGCSYTGGATEVLKKVGSSLNHNKLSPYEGDTENRTKSILEAHIGAKDSITNRVGSNVILNGFKDKAITVDSVEKLNAAECTNGKPLDTILPCDTAKKRMPSQAPQIVHVQATSRDDDTLATAQKRNDLLQASMRILHKKLDELCRQQLALQEEIAECEMNIQTILNGGEAGVGSNIEMIIEACNNLCKTQKPVSTPLSFEEQIPQQMKRKRLSEVVLSLQSPSQELDNICRLNCWVMPRYHVFPSLDSGMYQATIMVQGIDFRFTVDGALKSTPRDALDSAASNGLTKLRRMVEQAK